MKPRYGSRVRLFLSVAAALAAVVISCGSEDSDGERGEEMLQRLDRLRSLPYTSVTEDVASRDKMGVTLHTSSASHAGYNLYCSRKAPRAYLMDASGEVVHLWTYPEESQKFWEHVVLLDDGALLVAHKMRSLLKLDWNSDLIWRQKIKAHHDIAVADDGTLYAIVFGIRRYRGLGVRFPTIVHLTGSGMEIGRYDTYERLDEIKEALDPTAFLDTYLDSIVALGGTYDSLQSDIGRIEVYGRETGGMLFDYFHLNSVCILPDTPLGRVDPRFEAGNLLICFRNVNQILIVDPGSGEIVWAWGQGTLEWPHHPTMLENGNVLVFNNGCIREYTSVLELNPVTLEIEWEYGRNPEQRFYSPLKGSAQRLPNGNTLICDADNGRAIEVTQQHEIVWEWFNPETDEDGHRVQVYRMMRYPPEMVEPLLR